MWMVAILDAEARLDIRARGFWRDGQNAFFDVRVTNADAASQQNSSIKSILQKHEAEKKCAYNRRVNGGGTWLIYTISFYHIRCNECSAMSVPSIIKP